MNTALEAIFPLKIDGDCFLLVQYVLRTEYLYVDRWFIRPNRPIGPWIHFSSKSHGANHSLVCKD